MTQNSRKRIAFDLGETLGVPVIDGAEIVGFRFREGCAERLQKLEKDFALVLGRSVIAVMLKRFWISV